MYLPGPQMAVSFINTTHFAVDNTNNNGHNSGRAFNSQAYFCPFLMLSINYTEGDWSAEPLPLTAAIPSLLCALLILVNVCQEKLSLLPETQ